YTPHHHAIYTLTPFSTNASTCRIHYPFIFHSSADHRDLHSFPTRRSSDLTKVKTTSNRPPRKVIVGTVMQSFWGQYPGLHNRLEDRKSTRLNSSHLVISYAVFCLKKKKMNLKTNKTVSST